MRRFVIGVLFCASTFTGYAVGMNEGRIIECRKSWEKIEYAHDTWKRCEERFGRSLFR